MILCKGKKGGGPFGHLLLVKFLDFIKVCMGTAKRPLTTVG